jgi:hypothetical protein
LSLVIELAGPAVHQLERAAVPADAAVVAARTKRLWADAASFQPVAPLPHQLIEGFDLTSTQHGIAELDSRSARHDGLVVGLGYLRGSVPLADPGPCKRDWRGDQVEGWVVRSGWLSVPA